MNREIIHKSSEYKAHCYCFSLLHAVVTITMFGWLFVTVPLLATTVIPPSFDELVENAEIIFDGTVTAIDSRWAGENERRRIETAYTFRVNDVLKGSLSSSSYVLHVLGGTVGDVTLKVEGAPNFQLLERSILFVTKNGAQFVPLVGVMYGHYRVKKDAASNKEIIEKHDGSQLRGVEEIGKPLPAGGRLGAARVLGRAAEPMSPASFKDKVRARIQEQSR